MGSLLDSLTTFPAISLRFCAYVEILAKMKQKSKMLYGRYFILARLIITQIKDVSIKYNLLKLIEES